MTLHKHSPQRQREYALYRYRKALERGDFEAVGRILKQAERDALLDQMIAELEEISDSPIQEEIPDLDQVIADLSSSQNGQPPKSDQIKEDNAMYTSMSQGFTTYQPTVWRKGRQRGFTLVATILAMVIVGGLMLIMGRSRISYLVTFQATPTPVVLEKITPENVDRLMQLEEIQLDNVPYTALAFSPDGRYLAYGQSQTEVVLWNIDTRQVEKVLKAPNLLTARIAFSPDGKQLAIAERASAVLWNIGKEQEPLILPYGTEALGTGPLAFSVDGKILFNLVCSVKFNLEAIGCERIDTYGWDTTTGERIITLVDASGPATDNAISPVNQLSATGFSNGRLLTRDIISGDDKLILQYDGARITAIALSADGTLAAAANTDREIVIWSWGGASPFLTKLGQISTTPAFNIYFIHFNADHTLLATTGDPGDKYIHLWDIQGKKLLRDLEASEEQTQPFMSWVAFSPDGKLMASHSNDGKVRIWGVAQGS